MKNHTICMVSCLHPLYDDRIYWKEGLTLKKNGFNVIHLGVGDENSEIISEHGIRLISVRKKRYLKNPYLDILFRKITFRKNIYHTLLQKAKKLQSDAYHLHDLQLNRIGPKIKRLPHHPKLIYDVHEPYPEITSFLHRNKGLLKLARLALGRRLKKWQFNKSKTYDVIITTEENVAESFKERFPKKNISVIYNYCNLNSSEPDSNSNKIYDAIYTGGISGFRGVWTILNAALIAKKTNTRLKILMLGNIKEFKLKEKVEKFVSDNNISDFIDFKPFVPFHKVKEYYRKSRCGLVIFEDLKVYRLIWPIKTFEYMCFGLPVISSDFGHTYETIKKHDCGVGINPSSPEDLFDQILFYKNSVPIYDLHSKNATHAFEKKYKWAFMEEKLLKIYQNLFYSN